MRFRCSKADLIGQMFRRYQDRAPEACALVLDLHKLSRGAKGVGYFRNLGPSANPFFFNVGPR
jgi:hypothetical protein